MRQRGRISSFLEGIGGDADNKGVQVNVFNYRDFISVTKQLSRAQGHKGRNMMVSFFGTSLVLCLARKRQGM